MAASTLPAASLAATVMRSSSISASPLSSSGSMCTRRTSCLPLISTVTLPPAAWPMTVRRAISSCTLRMLCCRDCACFIRLPRPPRIVTSLHIDQEKAGTGESIDRLHQFRVHLGAEGLAELTHARVGCDGVPGRREALRIALLIQHRGGHERALARLDTYLQGLAVMARQGFFQPARELIRCHVQMTGIDLEVQGRALAPLVGAVSRELLAGATQAEGLHQAGPIRLGPGLGLRLHRWTRRGGLGSRRSRLAR